MVFKSALEARSEFFRMDLEGFAYQSPIEIIKGDMEAKMQEGVIRAIQKFDINVDEEELKKALAYDRRQYEQGYNDAMRFVKGEDLESGMAGRIRRTLSTDEELLIKIKWRVPGPAITGDAKFLVAELINRYEKMLDEHKKGMVRCKDCDSICQCAEDRWICGMWGACTDLDGWCHKGERRNDNG